ncbi:putative Glycosyl transferase group 1 [uncultured spirochete]|uniref:Putative Glycosyl transferase group 1 n=1 Tax=uncultured spirochete TaxID=156406 RepID=A0A3P3XSJ4_9SPIR|nr:putative Glycosyl transferase group 1 [uncultured spirochete]
MQRKHIVRVFIPGIFAYIGGAEKYTATIVQYLVNAYRNLDIGIVSYRHNGAGKANDIAILNENYDLALPPAIKTILLDDEGKGIWGRFIAHQRLRNTSHNVDLYMNCFHNVQFFKAAKNVHIVHFPAQRRVLGSPTFGGKPLLKPLADALDGKYKDCYDLFICNSRFSESWLQEYWGIEPERRAVLYPPVAHDATWSPDLYDQKKNIILLVSRFDPRKNMLEAVEYFVTNENRFSAWRLVVAGSCSDNDKEYYNRVALASRGHRVDIRPNLPKPELDELYQGASIFWHAMGLATDENSCPIEVEHFGITTVEAMSAGAVPVVIDKGGQREVVDDGINGFRWRTLDELGNVTQKLIADPALRRALAVSAVEKSNTYSLEAFYHAIDAIFMEHRLIPEEYRK